MVSLAAACGSLLFSCFDLLYLSYAYVVKSHKESDVGARGSLSTLPALFVLVILIAEVIT